MRFHLWTFAGGQALDEQPRRKITGRWGRGAVARWGATSREDRGLVCAARRHGLQGTWLLAAGQRPRVVTAVLSPRCAVTVASMRWISPTWRQP